MSGLLAIGLLFVPLKYAYDDEEEKEEEREKAIKYKRMTKSRRKMIVLRNILLNHMWTDMENHPEAGTLIGKYPVLLKLMLAEFPNALRIIKKRLKNRSITKKERAKLKARKACFKRAQRYWSEFWPH